MALPLPSSFYDDLTEDRLQFVAAKLLDIRYQTMSEMNSPFDCNYTREATAFGRSRNMLIDLCQRGGQSWLDLLNPAMDVTFKIGMVPCRFFRDDPDSPEKAGFFKRNAVDDLFAVDPNEPVMWRFVVEKALTEEDDDRVHFVGFNAYQEKVSEWVHRAGVPALHSVDREVPPSVEIEPAAIEIRDDEDDQVGKASPDSRACGDE